MKVGIIGLGYVGLPLGLVCAEAGLSVLGFDQDQEKINLLSQGESYISHIPKNRIQNSIDKGLFDIATELDRVKECDVILICVPTPLRNDCEPDLSYVLDTGKAIASYLKSGALVVLESTTYPGTTEEELLKVLEGSSKLKVGKDFFLAYSPEREDPGSEHSQFKNIPKLVSGATKECLEHATQFYKKIVNDVVPVSSCKVAEGAKLLENVFRSVNIALVNELKAVYDKMGIDVWEVIEAAKSKPFGFMPFYPGPGWGGHCIPVDPFYLTWKAKQCGIHSEFIELAGIVNRKMPDYVIERVEMALKEEGKSLNGSKVLVLGLAYKPDVDDDRESPTYVLIERLEELGCVAEYNDPYIPEIKMTRSHSALQGRRSQEISEGYDLLLLVTAHKEYCDKDFSNFAFPLVDTRNCVLKKPKKYYKA